MRKLLDGLCQIKSGSYIHSEILTQQTLLIQNFGKPGQFEVICYVL